MADSHKTTNLQSLPSELLISILSSLHRLDDVLSIAHTTRLFRQLTRSESQVWTRALREGAIAAGIYVKTEVEIEEETSASRSKLLYNLLGVLGSWEVVPARAWLSVLPHLSRNFVLYFFDLPPGSRLLDEEWDDLVKRRFAPSMVKSERQRLENVTRPRGKSRALFIKCLEKLEHKEVTGCAQQEHLVRYIVLHRSWGLTLNRMSSREYDPFRVFDELKKQNSLIERTTIQVPIDPRLCPPDLNVSLLGVVGKPDFRRNAIAQELLPKISKWRTNSTHAFLGPILLTASIRPSPDIHIPTKSRDYCIYSSLDLEDFYQICHGAGLSKAWFADKCEVKESGGYR